jgi:hypothetical protein
MHKQSTKFVDLIGVAKVGNKPWTAETFVTFRFRLTILARDKEIFIDCRSDDGLQEARVYINSGRLLQTLYSLISFQLALEHARHTDDTAVSHDNERATRSFV